MALADVAARAGVDPQCINLIAKWEGCLRKVGPDMYAPYRCPANVPTIGYGTTVYNETGRKVTMSDPHVSKEACEGFLAFDIGKVYGPAVDRLNLPWASGNQRSACISFAYNVGTYGFAKSTLCWQIKNKQWDRAAREFGNWTRGGGRVLPGLVSRRADERRLFLAPGGTLPKGGAIPVPETQQKPSATPSVTRTTISNTLWPVRAWRWIWS